MVREIASNVFYTGVNDLDIDLFEGQYVVKEGMSYNSEIIIDDKIVLFDTADKRRTNEWIANVEEVLREKAQGRSPDYLVVSHLEEDHAGSIEDILNIYPDIKLIMSFSALNMFNQFFDVDISEKKIVVKDEEELNIGSKTLKFFMAPMVHWPEVMFTYEKETGILFSADGFGKFGAPVEKLINDSPDDCEKWDDEARRYYINICGKYGIQVQAILNKIMRANCDIKMICPLHGPILKENLNHYVGMYDKWSKYEPEVDGTLIVYASIHGNTEEAARKLFEMMKEKGKNVQIMDIARCDISEAVSLAYKYSKLIVASVTYNMSIFPNMNLFLTLLKEKLFQSRKVGIIENGSWAPSSGKVMKQYFKEMKNIEIVEPIVTIKSKLNSDSFEKMKDLEKSF